MFTYIRLYLLIPSYWVDAANLYVPFYRQAHLRVFNDKFKVDGEKALWLAYSDIKNL